MLIVAVTLLSILAAQAIALPLCPVFPAHELQYIMDQSQASMLLSSEKFSSKADEVFREGLQGTPKYVKIEKSLGSTDSRKVELFGSCDGEGGLMLYTSGTTNRPVRFLDSHICERG